MSCEVIYLLFNAIEAMEDGGLITINASSSNGTVVVRISDNEPGIPREGLDHLFEPFHSTKPQGSMRLLHKIAISYS